MVGKGECEGHGRKQATAYAYRGGSGRGSIGEENVARMGRQAVAAGTPRHPFAAASTTSPALAALLGVAAERPAETTEETEGPNATMKWGEGTAEI